MYKIGVLESLNFLQEMGLLSETETEIIQNVSSTTLPVPTSLKNLFEGAAISFNDVQNLNVSRYARDFIEESQLGKGAFGEVYKGKFLSLSLSLLVCVSVCPLHFTHIFSLQYFGILQLLF